MIIAVDFDGTIVEHAYPTIGTDIPGAFEWLRKLQDAGAALMLWTIRSGTHLTEAVEHCKDAGIEFWGVNENPTQHTWSQSAKQYAHLYIDDAALGCPLVYPERRRPYVDWDVAGPAALAAVTA
jgi:ribonucleotide monophosphatase NagD (HAD superfamily)